MPCLPVKDTNWSKQFSSQSHSHGFLAFFWARVHWQTLQKYMNPKNWKFGTSYSTPWINPSYDMWACVVQFQDMAPTGVSYFHPLDQIPSYPWYPSTCTSDVYCTQTIYVQFSCRCILHHIQFRIGGIQFSPLGWRGHSDLHQIILFRSASASCAASDFLFIRKKSFLSAGFLISPVSSSTSLFETKYGGPF